MQDIYNYMPETNYGYKVYSDVAVLYLHFVLHVKLFRGEMCFVHTFTLSLSVVCVSA
jgi:hypothetical protein